MTSTVQDPGVGTAARSLLVRGHVRVERAGLIIFEHQAGHPTAKLSRLLRTDISEAYQLAVAL